MTKPEEIASDKLQLEALLVSRMFLYELFHKLLGGTPSAELLEVLTGSTTKDVLEEFGGEEGRFAGLIEFIAGLRDEDASNLLDRARDEYTRVFIGPAELPASPYESPYTGAHDMGLFQENTLAVRAIYLNHGFAPKRLQAVPDDHISLMCTFMAHMGMQSVEALRGNEWEILLDSLREQKQFLDEHLVHWLGIYAGSVRNSRAGNFAVLYPQLLEALDMFVKVDADFLTESSYWLEQAREQLPAESVDDAVPREEFEKVQEAFDRLADMRLVGIEDNELVVLC